MRKKMPHADVDKPQPDREYLQDEFTQAWVEKQVRDRTDDYLKKWRGVAALVIIIVSAALGVFGYQMVDLRKDLVEKAAQASKDVAVAEAKVTEAGTNVAASRGLVEQADKFSGDTYKQVNSTIGLLMANVNQSSNASTSLSEALTRLRREQGTIASTQKALEQEAVGFNAQRENITAAYEQQRSQLKIIEGNALGSLRSVEDSEKKVGGVYGNVQKIQEIYSDLLERRQVEYAFLRAHDSKILDFYSIVGLGENAKARHMRIMFSVAEIKDLNNITVQVLDDGTGHTGVEQKYEKLRQSVNWINIPETPFVFRVEFVYHAKLAVDFIALKVQAAG
jgi:hypothetical protein